MLLPRGTGRPEMPIYGTGESSGACTESLIIIGKPDGKYYSIYLIKTLVSKVLKQIFFGVFFPPCIVKSMGPQLSAAVNNSPRETEFQSLLDVLLDTFTNTSVKKFLGKEFIPRFYIILIIFPDYFEYQ